jgi:deazaflavin-dependent oxidoreductase (nitroreductase family)
LTPFIKAAVLAHVALYRLSGGWLFSRFQGMDVLLLTTTGRRTGKHRTWPLLYLSHDGGYLVTASNEGAHAHPSWYLNLLGDPRATVRIGRRRIGVRAEVAGEGRRQELWDRLASVNPKHVQYQRRAKRAIPVVLLVPASPRPGC